MTVNFNELKEQDIRGMNGGNGTLSAKMLADKSGKLIACRIRAGSSIGMHRHETSDDISYVLSGTGAAMCDGTEEPLSAGVCHICKKGLAHSITNTGTEDLVLFTVVVEHQ
ncbi:MAG: cupin domain-containing protein [Treponema sp.]|nr:cupin domain-containing protein [Treponema sp.]